MSFDALTVGGLLVALLSGGFLIGLVLHNDRVLSRPSRPHDDRIVAMTSQDR